MEDKRACWVCEVCGFAWLKSDVVPSHCASSKCRSRQWNRGNCKSILRAVRVPIDLDRKIEETGQSISAVMLAALRLYFSTPK
jgi:hypothetical protein